jgi:hypothetical protein
LVYEFSNGMILKTNTNVAFMGLAKGAADGK